MKSSTLTTNTATACTRKSFGSNLLRLLVGITTTATITTALPKPALADINTAAANGLPLLGRFEKLSGANSFIGEWEYTATKGIPSGILVFLKNGEVELRNRSSDGNGNGDNNNNDTVVAVGAVPWKYVSPKKGSTDTMITVSFTLDEENEDDVFIFQGVLDSAGGPDRVMEGMIATGRAEIGARGSGPMKKVGTFSAKFLK